MKRFLVILLTILVVLIVHPLQAQSDTKPPYLYYYSQLLGGLIIERADGTDSRQIAADVIPPNLTGLAGPGWSPSGKYFAAYRFIAEAYYSSTGTPYIIDLKGHPETTVLTSKIIQTANMQWSPTGEDILLITGLLHPDAENFFWLIDVAQGKVLAKFSTPIRDYFSDSMSEVVWDTTHQQIKFYTKARLVKEEPLYQITMHFDGRIEREEVTTNGGLSPLADTYPTPDFDSRSYGRATSPSGKYTVYGQHPAVLTDTQSGQQVNLPVNTQATICRDYVWTNEETYMITLDGTLIAGGGCASAAMGVTNPQGTLWRELGRCSWDYPPCVGWLPPQVDVRSLPTGNPKPIQLDPIRIEYDHSTDRITQSKEHPLKLFCGSDSTAQIRDTKAEIMLYTLTHIECPYNRTNLRPPDKGTSIAAVADPIHHLLATYTNFPNISVTVWQWHDDSYQPILKLNTLGLQLEFTSDDQYLRARNYNGWKIYAVADILAYASASK